MKSLLGIASAFLLAGSPLIASAAPANNGWILGVRGGATLAASDSADVNGKMAQRGHSVSTDLDSHDKAVVLSLDYRLRGLTSAELSVGSLGEYRVSATGTSTNPSRLAHDLIDSRPAGGRFISAGLRQDLPITGALSLTARAAAVGWRQESRINNGGVVDTVEDSDLGWMFGLAGNLRLTPNIGLTLGGDWYDQGRHGGIGLVHAGAEYHF